MARQQLILKWARFGPDEDVPLADDLSSLALDTIALCTMNYRFNSFYRDGMHPYVHAMNVRLAGAGGTKNGAGAILNRALKFFGVNSNVPTPQELQESQHTMDKISQGIIEERRESGKAEDDFLNSLLFDKDPKTGEAMRDELIRAQMNTFLVAGHETTSAMLAFTIIHMLKRPEVYRCAQEEVDQVLGTESVSVNHLRELKYCMACIHEMLRLMPTAPIIAKIPHPDKKHEVTVLGGKYKIEPTDRLLCLLGKCMQDPKVFGEDAREFKPERMLPDHPNYQNIEKYWRPFSEGSRSCIGRLFSLQEGILAMASILQSFDLRLSDPNYAMQIRHAITIKPMNIFVKTTLRNGMTPVELKQRLIGGETGGTKEAKKDTKVQTSQNKDGPPLTILYGSNQGTCQALAQRLASEASSSLGFNAEVQEMDAAVNKLSRDTPTIVITASYEGEPPDNALQFVQALDSPSGRNFEGVKYAVFGCGNKDWHETFHRIPKLCDGMMETNGGTRIADLGLSDVSKGNPMADFEAWLDKTLLPELRKLSGKSAENGDAATPDIEAEVSTGERVAALRQDLQVGTVTKVEILTTEGEQPEKRHMEVELPEGSTYECGDYLAVLPESPDANVRAVMAHFRLPNDATITLKSKIFSPLPLDTSISVADLLRKYYELAKPTTRRGLSLALKYTKDAATQKQLSALVEDEDKFNKEVTEAHTSIFDIVQRYPDIEMPFPTFLSLLPPMSIRQYSISSSPLAHKNSCTITYSLLTDQSDPDHPFYGVATTFLATLKAGDRIQVATRRTAKATFRLPLDAESTPLLMFAAGTGLAPFRGFIEQRAVQLEANPKTKLAPAYLFLGCRHSERDRVYAKQMDKWAKLGAVNILYAFSKEPEKSDGCKHVDDRMRKEVDTIVKAWSSGSRAYVCGNRAFAESVKNAAREIVEERVAARQQKEGLTDEQFEEHKKSVFSSFSDRAADDVFD